MDIENTEPTVEMTDETGELVVKQLAKENLTKGAWQTIMFLYREKDAKTGEFGDPKVSRCLLCKTFIIYAMKGLMSIQINKNV